MKTTRKGFTFIECLIIIAVIFIIGVLVIPNLILSASDDKHKSSWKKIYAELRQTSQLMIQESGTYSGAFVSSEDMRDRFKEYLRVKRTCSAGETIGQCWSVSGRYMNGKPTATENNPSLVLKDGMPLQFKLTDPDCIGTQDSGQFAKCGMIIVDVNGKGSPNTWGRDVFGIYVTEKGIVPFGSKNDGNDPTVSCQKGSKSALNTGKGCAARYLYN